MISVRNQLQAHFLCHTEASGACNPSKPHHTHWPSTGNNASSDGRLQFDTWNGSVLCLPAVLRGSFSFYWNWPEWSVCQRFIQRQTAKCTWLWSKFASWRITDTSPFPCSLPRPHEVRRKAEAGQGASRGEGQIFRWVGASRWKDWRIAREWRPLVLVTEEVAVVSMHQIAKDKVKQLCCAKISKVNAFAYCLFFFFFFAASL